MPLDGPGNDNHVGGNTTNVDDTYCSTTDFATDTEEFAQGAGSSMPWAGGGEGTYESVAIPGDSMFAEAAPPASR